MNGDSLVPLEQPSPKWRQLLTSKVLPMVNDGYHSGGELHKVPLITSNICVHHPRLQGNPGANPAGAAEPRSGWTEQSLEAIGGTLRRLPGRTVSAVDLWKIRMGIISGPWAPCLREMAKGKSKR